MNACRFARKFAVITLCLAALGAQRTFAQDASEVSKLPRGLAEVVKLVGSGIGDEVVISYIQNSPVPKPTANDLIELHRAKVPSPVIVALLSKPQKPIGEPTPVASAPTEARPAPAVQQVISAPPPATVYVERQPVYVQRDPVVIYSAPEYYRGYDWTGFGIDLGLHHAFGHHGGGHFRHHSSGHHGGGLLHQVFGGHHGGGHHGGGHHGGGHNSGGHHGGGHH